MLCRGVLEGGGATGLLNKGGGEQQASWFSKQQAVEFPQVLTSLHNNTRSRRRCTPAVCVWGGGGGGGGEEQQASCLVAKQAVEFPQVLNIES